MDILLKYIKREKGNGMTYATAKVIIKNLGMSGKNFSKLFGRNSNYVSDFSRTGVPVNIAIILKLSEQLARNGVENEEIIKIISSEIKKDK